MPRRGRMGSPMRSAPPRARAPPPKPAARSSSPNVPAKTQQPPSQVGHAQAGQPSMLKQIAGTAAGVAVGSAVGHTIGHMMTSGGGGGGDGGEVAADGQQQQYAQHEQAPAGGGICAKEMQQFMECAEQYSHDLSLCTGFNEVLRQCRLDAGQH